MPPHPPHPHPAVFLFFSVSRFSLSPCLSVSLSLCVFFSLSVFSVSLFPLSLCVRFSFLLCLSFLCPSVFLFSLSLGVLSLSFFPSPLWFLCLSASSVFVCCLIAFCLSCPALLKGATTKLRISFSGSIYYVSGGCGSIMLPPSPFTFHPCPTAKEGRKALF